MSRIISSHAVNVCNEAIKIEVLDEPGSGGANHHYFLGGYHTKGNPSADSSCDDQTGTHILFQNGPIKEAGINGLTNEALLAILIDRMEGFQSGQYATIENQIALNHLRSAAETLRFRTQQRERRGVEGTHRI